MVSVVGRTPLGSTPPAFSAVDHGTRTPSLIGTTWVLLSVLLVGSCAPEPARKLVTAPYVYVGTDLPDLTTVATSTGITRFVLSFLLSDGDRCVPSWNGSRALADAYARLGLTYMAGRNDTGSVTTLADARALRELAASRSLGFLGFWSLARDNGSCPGRTTPSARCSGLAQHSYAFTRSLVQDPRSHHHQAGGDES
ncbi:hypothetical protein [Saccharomonospora sp. NB11]|uniref:hypothetical protein n=1 Tax=Saccharomonospora sp. NB11 TaxID=1642298 RepID=UPI0018D0DA68|nr:hypothetical protein [Saccharomonospora sp. NB11]